MHIAQVVFIVSFFLSFSPAAARLSHRAHGGLNAVLKRKRIAPAVGNGTVLGGDDQNELRKRDGTKYVFMHHIVGNTYPYTQADWTDDIQQIQAKGIDAIALNMGGDDWQRTQIASAYSAAQALGTNFKLFISFDFTAMGCDLNDIVSRVNQFAHHPNQFLVNGKTMISSYSGDCLGNSGWASLKAQTNGYVMPFIWGLEGSFSNWPSLDSWYCWGCAWPQGNSPKNTDDDNYYYSQLGGRYAATISGWIYTHYDYKNFYLRGDDWLINSRWEQLIAMRSQLTFVEMVTWNDYGESDYFGPFKGAQPAGTTWANGFPHTAWFDMSQYYITAFKTGAYPAITQDVIYYWARPHAASASASSDSLGPPTGSTWTQDFLWAAVFATSTCTVTLSVGSSTQTFPNVGPGVTKLKIPLAPGQITVNMVRGGQTVINKTPTDFTFVNNPAKYNYNAYVGSAKGGSVTPTTTSITSTTSSTTTTSAAALSTSGVSWSPVGCYVDPNSPRVVNDYHFSSSSQTVATCLASCAAQGFAYGGTEYGVECWCGAAITPGSSLASSNDCNMACSGKSSDICGGGNRISLYSASAAAPPTTTTTTTSSTSTTTTTTSTAPSSTSTGFSLLGCVAEGTSGTRRALTAASFSQSNMTPLVCQSLCSAYQYAGVEYGRECYCGNSLTNNGATGAVIPSGNCPVSCAGDSSQTCGGSWTLTVYQHGSSTPPPPPPPPPSSWTSAGCYIDNDARILRGSFTDQAGMTTEQCTSICQTGGYTIAGTEYGTQCLCGSQLFKTNGAGVSTASSECNMACSGNSGETCGSGWRANLYTSPGSPAITRRHTKRRLPWNLF